MLLARRNLLRDRTRFLLSVLGVAVSIALILLLAGYRSGVYGQASAYLDNTPGSVVVAERGIRDFLGTSSVLPADAIEAVEATPGVARAIPVVSQFVIFERHGRKDGFFLIGYDPAVGGGPWKLVDGREPVADDELVIDRTTARQHDIAIGDQVTCSTATRRSSACPTRRRSGRARSPSPGSRGSSRSPARPACGAFSSSPPRLARAQRPSAIGSPSRGRRSSSRAT